MSLLASRVVLHGGRMENLIKDLASTKEFNKDAKNIAIRSSRAAKHYILKVNDALKKGEIKEESFDELLKFFAKEFKKLHNQKERQNASRVASNTNILDNRFNFVRNLVEDLILSREQIQRLNHPKLPFDISAKDIDRAHVASEMFRGYLLDPWLFLSDGIYANLLRYLISDSLTEDIKNSKPEPPARQKTIKQAASLVNSFGFTEDATSGLMSMNAIRSIAREIYRSTQETLRRNGIRSIKLYRGSSNEGLRQKLDSSPDGKIVTDLRLRPISSWTFSEELAHGFYGNHIRYGMYEPEKEDASRPNYKPYKPELQQKIFDNHVVYEADIPAEQVFYLPHFGAEDEVIVIGPTAKKSKVIRGDFARRRNRPKNRLSSGETENKERADNVD